MLVLSERTNSLREGDYSRLAKDLKLKLQKDIVDRMKGRNLMYLKEIKIKVQTIKLGLQGEIINKMEAVTIMTRKFLTNRLLNRKQMVVDVIHPGLASVSKKDLTEKIAQKFKVKPEQVILFGFKTQFGGGKSTGFCLVYDSKEMLQKMEPNYRLRRVGLLGPKTTGSRKQRKEKKNRIKKVRGKEKIKVAQAAGGKKK